MSITILSTVIGLITIGPLVQGGGHERLNSLSKFQRRNVSEIQVTEPAMIHANGSGQQTSTFICARLSGDGSPNENWPTLEQWMTYDAIWNQSQIGTGCTWTEAGGVVYNVTRNSDKENYWINQSIHNVAEYTQVDPRFVLVTVVQESSGCVRVPTTNSSVLNPGLMQSYNGTGSCFNMVPCPPSMILQMIEDGVEGDSLYSTVGSLNYVMQRSNVSFAQAYYHAARIYNGGNLTYNPLNILDSGNYPALIAYRLAGVPRCWSNFDAE